MFHFFQSTSSTPLWAPTRVIDTTNVIPALIPESAHAAEPEAVPAAEPVVAPASASVAAAEPAAEPKGSSFRTFESKPASLNQPDLVSANSFTCMEK